MSIEKRFLTAREISTYLGFPEDTIRKWIYRGKIPYSKFGRSIRFDLLRIEPWLKENEMNLTSLSNDN